jgi:hypothetical protein
VSLKQRQCLRAGHADPGPAGVLTLGLRQKGVLHDAREIHLCVLLSASSSSDDFVKFGPSPSCRFERASDRALAKMASDRALKSVPSSPTCPLLYPSHWPARSKAPAGAGFDPARVRGAAFTRAHTAGRRVRKACACAPARRGGGKQQ